MKKILLAVSTCLLAAVCQANTFTYDVNLVYAGVPPAGAAPWLRASFTDIAPNEVRLTMTALNLVAPEDVVIWAFNVDPSINPATLAFTPVSGAGAALTVDANNINMGPAHGFDILFSFGAGANSTLTAGATSVWNIAGSGVNFASFNTTNTGGPIQGLITAAHVQQIGANQNSGFIGSDRPDPPTSTPEPTTLFLMGGALLGVGLWKKRGCRHTVKSNLS